MSEVATGRKPRRWQGLALPVVAVLLAVLMSAPRRVFTRGQLLDAVFAGADSPGVIDTYVHYLRRKLGRGVVHTVHGTGYRLGHQ